MVVGLALSVLIGISLGLLGGAAVPERRGRAKKPGVATIGSAGAVGP